MDTVHAYRSAAMKQVSADGNVRQAETEELRRVAVARGQGAAPNPTPTNTMTGMLKGLGQRFGLSLSAPSPAQANAATAPRLRWLRSSEQFPRFDKCHSTGFEGCGNFIRRPRRVAG
jgi:hypothetical protein